MVFVISVGIAQPTLDTIRTEFRKKPHPFVTLNSRNSFVNNEIVNVFGIKAGLTEGPQTAAGRQPVVPRSLELALGLVQRPWR